MTMKIECVNGWMTITGEERYVQEVYEWLVRLADGAENITNNIMLDESYIFSFIYGDKNDGEYILIDGNFVHKYAAQTLGVVDVEPLEDGGYVWRNFEDFDEVDVTFEIEYDCSDFDYNYECN